MTLKDIVMGAPAISLEDMLRARDERAERLQKMLTAHHCPIASITLNIPGAHKAHALAKQAFELIRAEFLVRLSKAEMRVRQSCDIAEITGFEGVYAIEGHPAVIKRIAVSIEEMHPIGRVSDIDVLDQHGVTLHGTDFGRLERRCIICGGPVWTCSRSRAHPVEQLSLRIASLIREHLHDAKSDQVAPLLPRQH